MSYPDPIVFDELADFENGVETSLVFELTDNQQAHSHLWDISVRATEDLNHHIYTIPIENIQAKVTSRTSGIHRFVALSTQDQYLIQNVTLSKYQSVLPIIVNLKALGGNDFLQPSGAYMTTLVFTIVED